MSIAILLQALRTQTFQDWDLTLVDDNDEPLLRDNATITKLLWLIEKDGHRWHVVRGVRKGCHFAQNVLLVSGEHDLLCRVDDDLVPERDFLEHLVKAYEHVSAARPVGCVGGVYPLLVSPKLEDHILTDALLEHEKNNVAPFESIQQLYLHRTTEMRQVLSLYSCFLYNRKAMKEAGGFSIAYSRLGEKEDTDATMRLVMRNYSAVLEPKSIAFHFCAENGGSRLQTEERDLAFKSDIQLFLLRMKQFANPGFDWQAEAKANLSRFERYEAVHGKPSGFYFYDE